VSSPVQTSIWNKLIRYSDCVMPINRAIHTASDSTSDDGTADATANNAAAGKKDLGPSTVTLSGLLNAIDGVSSQVSGFLVTSS
jgi:chaperone BCS1